MKLRCICLALPIICATQLLGQSTIHAAPKTSRSPAKVPAPVDGGGKATAVNVSVPANAIKIANPTNNTPTIISLCALIASCVAIYFGYKATQDAATTGKKAVNDAATLGAEATASAATIGERAILEAAKMGKEASFEAARLGAKQGALEAANQTLIIESMKLQSERHRIKAANLQEVISIVRLSKLRTTEALAEATLLASRYGTLPKSNLLGGLRCSEITYLLGFFDNDKSIDTAMFGIPPIIHRKMLLASTAIILFFESISLYEFNMQLATLNDPSAKAQQDDMLLAILKSGKELRACLEDYYNDLIVWRDSNPIHPLLFTYKDDFDKKLNHLNILILRTRVVPD